MKSRDHGRHIAICSAALIQARCRNPRETNGTLSNHELNNLLWATVSRSRREVPLSTFRVAVAAVPETHLLSPLRTKDRYPSIGHISVSISPSLRSNCPSLVI